MRTVIFLLLFVFAFFAFEAESEYYSSLEHERCKYGLTKCYGKCVSLFNSSKNCGKCGKKCPTNAVCKNRKCRCKKSFTACKGKCLPECPSGGSRNPTTCECSGCPSGTFTCGQGTLAPNVCCTTEQTCQCISDPLRCNCVD